MRTASLMERDEGALAVRLDRDAAFSAPVLTVVQPQGGRRVFAGPDGALIVALARGFVLAHLADKLDAAALANVIGVSESTLRRIIHAEVGMQLSVFIAGLKLDQARAWLSTNRESRSQAQIASALGFRSAAAFGRAYVRRYGESMSVTRCRAVKLGEVSAVDVGSVRRVGGVISSTS